MAAAIHSEMKLVYFLLGHLVNRYELENYFTSYFRFLIQDLWSRYLIKYTKWLPIMKSVCLG